MAIEIGSRDSTVGDVRHSVLSEAQFQSINGAGWVLMDGRSITGSALATVTGWSTLPDARGQFLRGKNNGRADGNQDPGGERAIGNLQGQATAKNGLAISDPGHVHGNTISSTGAGSGTIVQGGGTLTTINTNSASTGVSLGAGDAETRPRNIALNIFIKIN